MAHLAVQLYTLRSLVHISDTDESRSPTSVGDGILDIDPCASAVNTSGVE